MTKNAANDGAQHTAQDGAEVQDRNGTGSNREGAGNAGKSHAAGTPKEEKREVFVISVAAEITGMHAQTLRTYDRIGLVTPERTRGGGRRYSREDIDQLREIQRLSHEEGVNLAGIKTIIEQQNRIARLNREIDSLEAEAAMLRHKLTELQTRLDRGEGGGRSRGEIVHVPRSTAVVLWEQRRGKRR
ncbi:Putative heat shock protein HspR [Corynebacterium auriscanis]|nr:Putative heat shock protein HspR [Corynebacterium auriscanis]